MDLSLSPRVIKGGVWLFFLRITQQIFLFARLVILARILAPNDFGLIGIAMLTFSILEVFSEPGFSAALIQKKEDIKKYLNTAWTFLILRGFVLFIIIYLIASYVALFFKTPQATSIIQAMGISLLLKGLTNIGIIYFQKELQFQKKFIYEFIGIIVDFIVTISLVLILKNVWAIVFGILSANFTKCIISYFMHPFKPRISLDTKKAKELWDFGKWVFGSNILTFLINNGDNIFVGKFLGVVSLGFYQMAYRISNLPATEITQVISQITFPAYSKMQDNIQRLKEAYLRTLQVISFLSFFISGLIFALSYDFTKIFLGEKWLPIVPAINILVLAGLVRSLSATTGSVFQAVGRPDIITKWQPVRLTILLVLIYPLALKWEISGVSCAVFFANFVSFVGFSFIVIKITKCEIKNFTKRIILPLINALVMILFIHISKITLTLYNINLDMLKFFILAISSSLIYTGISYILDREAFSKVKEIFQTLREKEK